MAPSNKRSAAAKRERQKNKTGFKSVLQKQHRYFTRQTTENGTIPAEYEIQTHVTHPIPTAPALQNAVLVPTLAVDPQAVTTLFQDEDDEDDGDSEAEYSGDKEIRIEALRALQARYNDFDIIEPPDKKQRLGCETRNRPSFYSGNSRTTKWRIVKRQEEKARGCMKLEDVWENWKKKRPPPVTEVFQVDLTSDEKESEDFAFELDKACVMIDNMIDNEIIETGARDVVEAVEIGDHQFEKEDGSEPKAVPDTEICVSEDRQLDLRESISEDDGEDFDIIEFAKGQLKQFRKFKTLPTAAVINAIMMLSAVIDYVRLRSTYESNNKCSCPWMSASLKVARRMAKGVHFARRIRFATNYLITYHRLPPSNRGKGARHICWLDNEEVLLKIKLWLAEKGIGEIKPRDLQRYFLANILPAIDPESTKNLPPSICVRTIRRWLRKLGYEPHAHKKGVYVDGHERPDVKLKREKYLNEIQALEKKMSSYDDKTLQAEPPNLASGEREHVLVFQDESIFHANDLRRSMWLAKGQMPIRQKGNGRPIMVSDFVCEKTCTGRVALSLEERNIHDQLPEDKRLRVTDARRTIYPGKGHDEWWDMRQLNSQKEDMIDIFEYLLPDCTAITIFDCSSAHEALASDALHINKMNFKPGGKQAKLRNTIIPKNNPPPPHGSPEYRGKPQSMVFEAGHPQAGEPKGMVQVLKERTGVWAELVSRSGGKTPHNTCNNCKLSQRKQDALARLAEAERAGHEEIQSTADLEDSEENIIEREWCCVKRVLMLQEDFLFEKPELQRQIEARGHICLFLPKFHCELNPIEMYWGFAKHRFREANDGKFSTARELVPQTLDSCNGDTIRRFYRKVWRYMDSYRKGLTYAETAFAVKKYRSHRRVPEADEVREALRQAQQLPNKDNPRNI